MSSLLPLQGLAPITQTENLWDSSSRYKLPTTEEEAEVLVENLLKDFNRAKELQAGVALNTKTIEACDKRIEELDSILEEATAKQAQVNAQRAEIQVKRAEVQTKRAEVQAEMAEVDTKLAEVQANRAAIQQRRAEIQKELNTGPSDAALLARLAKIRAAKAQALAQTKQ